jgi:hypothetical protein
MLIRRAEVVMGRARSKAAELALGRVRPGIGSGTDPIDNIDPKDRGFRVGPIRDMYKSNPI